MIGGGWWEVRVKVDLTLRADTGRINTSPVTAVLPIIRLQHGCSHTIQIPGVCTRANCILCCGIIYSVSILKI